MNNVMSELKFIFRNGETWTVNRDHIGDLWIKQVTTSFGRINGGEFEEIHPCASFKIEVLPEADYVATTNINYGGLEMGMFDRIRKFADIERMEIHYHPKANSLSIPDQIYFPYEPQDEDGTDNKFQTTALLENGNLLLALDYEKTVDELFPQYHSAHS